MTAPRLFHVAAVELVTEEASRGGAIPKMILDTTTIMAHDSTSAIAQAGKLLPAGWEPSRTKFFIREFKTEA